MKRLIVVLAFLLAPMIGHSQTIIHRATLMYAFDLDGEAADADQIVTAANGDLIDAQTFTITAQPDACRLIDMTVTDANSSISAGAVAVVGTDCFGRSITATFTFASGGSGVKTLDVATASTWDTEAYFATITSVTTGTLTGEGGAGVDFMTLGYTSNSVNGWAVYGKSATDAYLAHKVDVFGFYEVPKLVTTSGSMATTVAGLVGADDPFELVSVGDLIIIRSGDRTYERKVTARASADSITVNAPVLIPEAGTGFRYKKAFYSPNPDDDLSFSVNGYKTLMLVWSVDANANTGGVITSLQCSYFGPEYPDGPWVELTTTTVASGGTQADTTESVDLTALPYSRCRFGVRFGTGDDADGAAENINASIVLVR